MPRMYRSASGCSTAAPSPKNSPTATPASRPARMRSDGRPTFGGAGSTAKRHRGHAAALRRHGRRRWNSNPVTTDAASQISTSTTLIAANCDTPSAKTVVPSVDRGGGQHVARAHDQAVDHLLGLVLLLARGGQEQHLPHRVHQRVVDRVLDRLDPAHDGQRRQQHRHAVAAERHHRQHAQRHRHAQPLDQPRDEEQLQHQADEVDELEVVGEERADEAPLVGRRQQCPQRSRPRRLCLTIAERMYSPAELTQFSNRITSAMPSR